MQTTSAAGADRAPVSQSIVTRELSAYERELLYRLDAFLNIVEKAAHGYNAAAAECIEISAPRIEYNFADARKAIYERLQSHNAASSTLELAAAVKS